MSQVKSLIDLYTTLVYQIVLVAYEYHGDTWIASLLRLMQPFRGILKRFSVSQIEGHNNSVTRVEVALDQTSKSFLSASVPDLDNALLIVRALVPRLHKINAYSLHTVRTELLLDIALHDRTFSNEGVANYYHAHSANFLPAGFGSHVSIRCR